MSKALDSNKRTDRRLVHYSHGRATRGKQALKQSKDPHCQTDNPFHGRDLNKETNKGHNEKIASTSGGVQKKKEKEKKSKNVKR